MSNFLTRLAVRNSPGLLHSSGVNTLVKPRFDSNFYGATYFTDHNYQANGIADDIEQQVNKDGERQYFGRQNATDVVTTGDSISMNTGINSGMNTGNKPENAAVKHSSKTTGFVDDDPSGLHFEINNSPDKVVEAGRMGIDVPGTVAAESIPIDHQTDIPSKSEERKLENSFIKDDKLQIIPNLQQDFIEPSLDPVSRNSDINANKIKGVANPDLINSKRQQPEKPLRDGGHFISGDTFELDRVTKPSAQISSVTSSEQSEIKPDLASAHYQVHHNNKLSKDHETVVISTSVTRPALSEFKTDKSSDNFSKIISDKRVDLNKPLISVQDDNLNHNLGRSNFTDPFVALPAEFSSINKNMDNGSTLTPTVKVSIGRIEIRSTAPTPPPIMPAQQRPRRGPAMSLDNYLAKSKRGPQ